MHRLPSRRVGPGQPVDETPVAEPRRRDAGCRDTGRRDTGCRDTGPVALQTPVAETPVGEAPPSGEAEALLPEPAPSGDPAPLSFVTAPPVGADEPDRGFDAVAEPTIAPELEDEQWTECEITYWRGHVHGEFIAAHFNGLARIDVRWQSVLWPGRDTIPEEKPRTVAALDALDAQLLQDGWERHGHGDWWYARRYRRRISDTEVAEPHQPTPPPGLTRRSSRPRRPSPRHSKGPSSRRRSSHRPTPSRVDLRLRSENIQIRDYLPWRYLRVTPAPAAGAVADESAASAEPALAEAGLDALLADETAPAEDRRRTQRQPRPTPSRRSRPSPRRSSSSSRSPSCSPTGARRAGAARAAGGRLRPPRARAGLRRAAGRARVGRIGR